MLNITSQCQDLEILCFSVIRSYYEKLGRMLKPPVSKFRSDLSVRLKDIAEKQVPVKLKPIVGEKTNMEKKMHSKFTKNKTESFVSSFSK